jgi:hypothetical protein
MTLQEIAEYSRQLNVYALYAQKHLGARADELQLTLAHMNQGKLTNIPVTLQPAEEVEAWIQESANAMRRKNVSMTDNRALPDAFLTGSALKRTEDPVRRRRAAHAETLRTKKRAAQSNWDDFKSKIDIEGLWDSFTPKAKGNIKMGGALGGLAILGWWMFSDSHKRSRRGDARSRGYGWSPADAQMNAGASTARMMYTSGGFGGMA